MGKEGRYISILVMAPHMNMLIITNNEKFSEDRCKCAIFGKINVIEEVSMRILLKLARITFS